jgi:antitoxin component YwqK of YwqJK toxin-antitoxin module
MKRILSTIAMCSFVIGIYAQSDVDTLYYDKDWKGVENKAFASFYRIIPKSGDPNYRKPMRDYYITGELQSEGFYLTIDKYDDSNSVFEGDFTNYFKSGKVEIKGSRVNGKNEGEWIKYRENGLVEQKINFKNGKPDGLFTQFSEDGNLCYQMEYSNGESRYNWYMVSDQNGNCSKIRISDNTPIYESPELSEKKVEYQKGEAWPYYNKNGIMLGMTNNQVKDYGKWYQIPIVISNNSLFPIDFDPTEIKAVLVDKNGKETDLRVYSANDYMKKVRRSQNWAMALTGLAEGMAAANAGYSTSTTNSTYNGYSSSYGSASAHGSGGYAHGTYSGSTSYHGNSTSTTTSYNGLAAYQAQVIASNRMADYQDALLSERQAKDEGYLKLTTVNPGETISGYVNIERKKGDVLYIYVKINNAIYTFPWNVSN